MNPYKIISDTASDINTSVLDAQTLQRVPFYVTFDKVNSYKEITEMSVSDFYKNIAVKKFFVIPVA